MRLIGHPRMGHVFIIVGKDGNSLNTHRARGLNHPHGNLTTVGDQYFTNLHG
jgi:hypothetical protein